MPKGKTWFCTSLLQLCPVMDRSIWPIQDKETVSRYLHFCYPQCVLIRNYKKVSDSFDETSLKKSRAYRSKQKVTQMRGRDVTFGTSA